MCKWWKDNFDFTTFDTSSQVWKIMIFHKTYYGGFYLAEMRFCPGCGNRLGDQGCVGDKTKEEIDKL